MGAAMGDGMGVSQGGGGGLDVVTRERVAGWIEGATGERFELVVDGLVAARLVADGRVPFDVPFEPPMAAAPHRVVLRREDGAVAAAAELAGLRGRLDQVDRERVRGWAEETGRPGEAVTLVVLVDGEAVGRVIANAHRDDLERHGIGVGRHAFEHVFEPPLSLLRHVVAVTRAEDGAALGQSPVLLQAPERFDLSLRDGIIDALDTAADDAELRARLLFLAEQMERLLQRRSDRASNRTERLAAQRHRRRWLAPGESEAAPVPRALVVDTTMPDLSRDAGSAAVVSHALSLQRLGHEVVFAAADMSAKGAEALEAVGIGCCHAPWFGSVEEVLMAQSHCFDVVYLHRVATALPYLALVRRHLPKARVIYSVADLHHVRLARQAVVEERPELAAHARLVRRQELLAAAEADVVITHSPLEAEALRQLDPAPRVHVVPWAVTAAPGAAPFARRSGFAFVGHYGHQPNLDAALWLIEEVMPVLQRLNPAIVCRLVGSSMPPVLERPRAGVLPVGAVPDLSGLLGGVRLTVAPLQYGAGVKGKVLDSLAAGVPCVCTPVAMEGLALGPALRSLVAADARGFAASIHRLHTDPALHEACRREGLAFVAAELSPERIDTLMRAALT